MSAVLAFQWSRNPQSVCGAGTNTLAALNTIAGITNVFSICDIDGTLLQTTITTGAFCPVKLDLHYADPIEEAVYRAEGAKVSAPESSEEIEQNEWSRQRAHMYVEECP